MDQAHALRPITGRVDKSGLVEDSVAELLSHLTAPITPDLLT